MISSTETEQVTGNLGLQSIKSILVSDALKKETIEECLDYIPKDGDVIITTYPKAGTTWMQYIVHQILTKSNSFPNLNDMMEKIIPYVEKTGMAAVDAMVIKPRVYKYHFPYDKIKKNPNTKFIYVYRRPEDIVVSYYYFKKRKYPSLDFDKFFENFLIGNTSYGSYFDHLLSYWKHRKDGNILLVSYEALHDRRKEEIFRISKFLGEEYFKEISNDEFIVNKIISNTTFDFMKQNLVKENRNSFQSTEKFNRMPRENADYFRSGLIGHGKQTLKENQLKRLKALATEKMKGTDILKEWFEL